MAVTKFQFKMLRFLPSPIDMLTVRSYAMNIYLVELTLGEQSGLVYEGDRPKRFNGLQHIRNSFDSYTAKASQLLHESPYDEMIGNPDSAQSASALPFSMSLP